MPYNNPDNGASAASQSPWQPPDYIFKLRATGLTISGNVVTKGTPAPQNEWAQEGAQKYQGLQLNGTAELEVQKVSSEKVEQLRNNSQRGPTKKGAKERNTQWSEVAEPNHPNVDEEYDDIDPDSMSYIFRD